MRENILIKAIDLYDLPFDASVEIHLEGEEIFLEISKKMTERTTSLALYSRPKIHINWKGY